MPSGDRSHARLRPCVEVCSKCAQECEHCGDACITEDRPDCAKMCIDCADICWSSAGFMSRGSQFTAAHCDLCAACAAEGEGHHNEHCQQCARAGRRCAEECRTMAGAAA